MAQGRAYITLGELLDEKAETEQEEAILERVKNLAQETLPVGWTAWEVVNISKEESFGDRPEPNILNKLMFALPTVGLARAFNPDADHLSEKGYREMRYKLLDWAFARALILGPPSIANRIRGSAARTELFKQSVAPILPLLHTRLEASKILSGNLSEGEETSRKRRSSTVSGGQPQKRRTISPIPSTSHSQDRIEGLERRMENMFSILLEKIEGNNRQHQPISDPESDKENYFSDSDSVSDSSGGRSWIAPDIETDLGATEALPPPDIEFRPKVKEADPAIPEPTEPIRKEGIECQRLGSEGWSRIRYKEVEKRLHAAPVFSALKVNVELGSLSSQPSPWLAKQEGMLGTISHALLLQRKALADGLNRIRNMFPEAGEELRKLLSDDSQFKMLSDDLLQFVCAHRAETIEIRRKSFKPRNEVLSCAVHGIPPSPTHLFEEKKLATFLRDNGGVAQVFQTSKHLEKREAKETFRRPARPLQATKGRQQSWRSRPSTSTHTTPARSSAYRTPGGSKPSNKQRDRSGKDKKLPKSRKY